jgi:hypothetical protein
MNVEFYSKTFRMASFATEQGESTSEMRVFGNTKDGVPVTNARWVGRVSALTSAILDWLQERYCQSIVCVARGFV